MVELDCERRIAEMEKSFEAFLEFQASPAYQTFLQWSERLGSLEAPSELQLTATENAISDGDTAWMLMATTLVLFMTIPGQTIFFAGIVLFLGFVLSETVLIILCLKAWFGLKMFSLLPWKYFL